MLPGSSTCSPFHGTRGSLLKTLLGTPTPQWERKKRTTGRITLVNTNGLRVHPKGSAANWKIFSQMENVKYLLSSGWIGIA
eukprot:1186301-Prorocentrum_minimum.AAC.2